jgi:hypothetical protein
VETLIKQDLMTRWTGSTEHLHISFDQASEKAAEWALWFEVSFRIFLKSLYTAWRTEVVRSTFIRANHCFRVSQGDLHPAYRVHKFFLSISSHWSIQGILLLNYSNKIPNCDHGFKPRFRQSLCLGKAGPDHSRLLCLLFLQCNR